MKGSLYACDFTYMYNFLKRGYQIIKLCSFSDFKIEEAEREYSTFIVKKSKIFLFCSKQGNSFVKVLKGVLPREPTGSAVSMEITLEGKVRNRRGYAVAWVK